MELLWLQQAINSRKEVATNLEPFFAHLGPRVGVREKPSARPKQTCLVQYLFFSLTVPSSQTNTEILRSGPEQT